MAIAQVPRNSALILRVDSRLGDLQVAGCKLQVKRRDAAAKKNDTHRQWYWGRRGAHSDDTAAAIYLDGCASRAAEVHLMLANNGERGTRRLTALQSQHLGPNKHQRRLRWPQTDALPHPHDAPDVAKPLLPRSATGFFFRIHVQVDNTRRRWARALPAPRLMAVHIDHPRTLQGRQAGLLHAAAPVRACGPAVL
jgi:hypothetical protein